MTRVDFQASVTKAAADVPFNGTSLSIATNTTLEEVVLLVTALTADKEVRLVLEDTVDAYTASIPVAVVHLKGAITSAAPRKITLKKRDIMALRNGVTSAAMRWSLQGLDTDGSVTFESWVIKSD